MLKKAIISALMMGGLVMAVPSVQANTATTAAAGDPQIRVQIGGQPGYRNRHRARSRIVTRVVRHGRYSYRETLRVTYLPYGGVRTQVIDRQRIWG